MPTGGGPPSLGRPGDGRWSLYDEKFVLSGKGIFNAKAPQTWLQDIRDYLAGRSIDLDHVLDWVERQTVEIPMVPDQRVGDFPMFVHCPAEPREVSRQLWAFLGPLVAGDGHKTSTFKNVARHNGLEAWRQIALPINEDKVLILQELLPLITNPRSASSIDHYDDAVRDWTTNLRLFKEAGGEPPTGDAQRLAFTKLLPHDVAAHVTLHMNLPQYRDFHELRKFTDNYVKVMTSLDRQRKGVKSSAPVRLVEAFNGQMEEDGWAIDGEEPEEEDFVYPALDGLDVEQRVEVLAFMKASTSTRCSTSRPSRAG